MGSESEKKPEASKNPHEHHDMSGHEHMQMEMEMDGERHDMSGESYMNHVGHHDIAGMAGDPENAPEGGAGHMHHGNHDMSTMDHMNHNMEGHDMPKEVPPTEKHEQSHDMSHMDHSAMKHGGMNHGAMHNMHMPSADQPMFPTVTIAVCHCGAGCLLGDIVGEWLVFGTNATLGGRSIGSEFLIGNFATFSPSLRNPLSRTLIYCLLTRLRLRPPFRHLLPILLHSAHVRRLRPQISLASGKSRFPLLNFL
jgi:hypothetical protein